MCYSINVFGYINEYNIVQEILSEMLDFLCVCDNKFLVPLFNFS
jgi:hypothetical protein